MIHVRPIILNDFSSISAMDLSAFLNVFGYIRGIIPSIMRTKANTKATVSKLVIF